jgi:hypothetical protein
MTWDQAPVFELPSLSEVPQDLALFLRREPRRIRVIVLHVGVLPHLLGVLPIFLNGRDDKFVLELAVVRELEPNLFPPPDLDPAGENSILPSTSRIEICTRRAGFFGSPALP